MVHDQSDFAADIAKLINFALDEGYLISFGEAYRTAEQQAIYAKEGLTKTMDSNHLRRLAVDFNLFSEDGEPATPEDYKALGDYWISLSPFNRWGGNFSNLKDLDHFERNV